MTAYVIAQIQISDPEVYQQYSESFMPTFASFKGEVTVVGDSFDTLEGKWDGGRTVILKFPDKAEALRWCDLPEYQEIIQLRFKGANANIILAEGFIPPTE